MALAFFLFVPQLKWWLGLSLQVHTKPPTGRAYILSSVLSSMKNELSSFREVRVHHMPCFISGVSSS
jgi:hypothetical protein